MFQSCGSGELNLVQALRCCVERPKLCGQILVRVVDRIRLVEHVQFFCGDCAPLNEGIEVDHLIPVFIAKEHDRHCLSWFLGLNQSEDLEEFVHRSEAARENDQSLRQIDEPELAHEEVMKIEDKIVGHIVVHCLLVGQTNVESDGLASGE